jgi:hypothetical protein
VSRLLTPLRPYKIKDSTAKINGAFNGFEDLYITQETGLSDVIWFEDTSTTCGSIRSSDGRFALLTNQTAR